MNKEGIRNGIKGSDRSRDVTFIFGVQLFPPAIFQAGAIYDLSGQNVLVIPQSSYMDPSTMFENMSRTGLEMRFDRFPT
jgi:hypothetical protein